MKEENKKIIVIIIPIIMIITSIFLLSTTLAKEDNITLEEVNNIINNQENALIYIFNSKSNNKYTDKIFNHLDDNEINYYVYDISKVTKEEYQELLKILNVELTLDDVPMIVYINEGIIFANIININNIEIVEKFIKDYDLGTIR